MILFLVVALAAQPVAPAQAVAGCISIGPALHCDLAPIAATPVALPVVDSGAITVTSQAGRPSVAAERRSRRRAAARLRAAAVDDAATRPAADRVAAHIESLVEIGDCTGARTYARLIGDSGLADRAFARCLAPTTAQLSAAR